MGTKISLDFADLRSSAAQVKSSAGNLESELNKLEGLIRTTAGAWEGPAKEAFEQKFQTTYKRNLKEIKESLMVYAKEMESFADRNDALQNEGARRFSSI